MIHKVYKIIFADMEREEAWLNEMAQKGYNFLDNLLMRYTFSKGEPNEYTYRIELLEYSPKDILSQEYIKFLSETGVECVSTSGRWAYFRKKTEDGPFDLYSDIDQKIRHYKRNISYVLTILLFNLIILGINLFMGFAKKLPANVSISISVFVFTFLLARTLYHYIKQLKHLKEEQRVHE